MSKKITPQSLLESLKAREATCWAMAQTFLDNRDAHGVMDIGSELESLKRAIMEVGKL